jgi:hypothetical protein
MNLSPLPPDATDLYLRGELDASTKALYEQHLEADPAMKADLEFQETLTQGLGVAKRRAELKSMLQQTPVSAGFSFLQSGLAQWSAAAISAAVVVGTLWYINQPSSTNQDASPAVAVQSATSQATTSPSVPTLPAPEASSVLEEPLAAAEPAASQVSHADPVSPQPKVHQAQQPSVKRANQASDQTSTFDEPSAESKAPAGSEMISGVGDNMNSPSVLPKNNAESASAVSETILKTDPAYQMHYQFVDGKLYLYGKFNKGLYEVIDLSGKNGKRSFLYYQETYYQVLPGTSKITALEQTADKSIVASLDKLRKK